MNTPQRISALLLLITAGASPALWADTGTAAQAIDVTVPKVLLIAVEDTAPTVTFTAPTVAGKGFEIVDMTGNMPHIAITSNAAGADLFANAVMSDGKPLSDYNLKLGLMGIGGVLLGSSKPTLSIDNGTKFKTVGKTANGILAVTTNQVAISADVATTGGMMPYSPVGGYHATITYTLAGT